MTLVLDREFAWVFGGVVVLLAITTAVGRHLGGRAETDAARATVANLNARIGAW